jgi:hypothetical protein
MTVLGPRMVEWQRNQLGHPALIMHSFRVVARQVPLLASGSLTA